MGDGRAKTENREGRNDDPCALSRLKCFHQGGTIVPLAAGNANFHLRSSKRGRCLLRFVLFEKPSDSILRALPNVYLKLFAFFCFWRLLLLNSKFLQHQFHIPLIFLFFWSIKDILLLFIYSWLDHSIIDDVNFFQCVCSQYFYPSREYKTISLWAGRLKSQSRGGRNQIEQDSLGYIRTWLKGTDAWYANKLLFRGFR